MQGGMADVQSLSSSHISRSQGSGIANMSITTLGEQLKRRYGFHPQAVITFSEMIALRIALALFYDLHPNKTEENIREHAYVEGMNRTIKAVLGKDIGYIRGNSVMMPALPTMDGREFHPNYLSDGERILFAWAISLYEENQGRDIPSNAIISIDEPELHLHPSAAVDVLDRLNENLISPHPDRQLWIATHCPAIIAHFNKSSIFYVREGRVEPASKKMSVLMDGLLGGDEGRDELRTFIDEADRMAFASFAAECLTDALVSTTSVDSQSRQVVAYCKSKLASDGALRVLDYGAGKGRFAHAVADKLIDHKGLDYFMWDDRDYDTSEKLHSRLEALSCLYKSQDVAARTSFQITDFQYERQVDLVIMCNFLHEIQPKDWKKHFKRICACLREGGFLLILEDQLIEEGELPNKTGFIVLNIDELRCLFGSADIRPEPTSEERCSAIAVPRSVLASSTRDDRSLHLESCLKMVRERVKREISQCRMGNVTGIYARRFENERKKHYIGKAHARATIMLANCTLALDDLNVDE